MKIIKTILFLSLLILPSNIYASDCTLADLNNLKVDVYSSTITYSHISNNKFNLIFNNLNNNFYIQELVSKRVIDYEDSIDKKTISNYLGGVSYTFYYYGEETSECPNTLLRVQSVSLPEYNLYSERAECEGISEYEFCGKWFPGTITEELFVKGTAAYKEAKENEVEEPEKEPIVEVEEDQQSLWDYIMDYLNQEYVLLLLGIAIAGSVGIVILKIRRRR